MATFSDVAIEKLTSSKKFQKHIVKKLGNYDITVTFSGIHDFPNNSFTAVFGLAESHISVHTWPEIGKVQFDVFLCNYQNDNRDKGKAIFDEFCSYFDTTGFKDVQTIARS